MDNEQTKNIGIDLPVGEPIAPPTDAQAFDPKLLASHLEDSWTDEKPVSPQIFHQPLPTTSEAPVISEPQIVEKVVYQKQRVHGFFRTLTIIALLFVGVLMLLEQLSIFSLSIGGVAMNTFYPVVIILSGIIIWSYKGLFGKIFGLLMFLSVVAGSFVLSVYSSLTPSNQNISGSSVVFPLESGHRYSKVYVSTLINTLNISGTSLSGLLSSHYDTQRSLILSSGQILSGHTYAIVQESDTINLLERVLTSLNIGLSSKQPIYLYTKTLLGQNNLDLTDVRLRGLTIDGGVVTQDVILGSGSSHVSVNIQSALAEITLHIPKDMGVRMHYHSYLGKTDFPGLIEKAKDTYESPNLDKASSIVDINAVFGLSKFTLLQDR